MTLDPDMVREAVADASLYLLLTRKLCAMNPLELLEEALEGGVELVQVREPEASDRDLLAWVRDVREVTAAHRVPLVVNNRVDIALAAGAEGVHLGQDDMPPAAARSIAGTSLLIGLSTHNLGQITKAASHPIDYIGLGPCFDTETKGLKGIGTEEIGEWAPHSTMPTFVIGGISLALLPELRDAGIGRVAVSSAICASDSPRRVAEGLRSALN